MSPVNYSDSDSDSDSDSGTLHPHEKPTGTKQQIVMNTDPPRIWNWSVTRSFSVNHPASRGATLVGTEQAADLECGWRIAENTHLNLRPNQIDIKETL